MSLSGESQMSNRSLGEQLQAFYNCILDSPEEAAQRELAFDRIRALVMEVLPSASVHLVGSSASGLASKNSSVDLTVEVEEEEEEEKEKGGVPAAATAVSKDRERADKVLGVLRLREGEFLNVQTMHSRLVSVVTCVYRQADLRCSVRLGCGHHRRAAAFLGGVASLCEPFRLLTVVTREWALSRQLIRRKGALTGYAVALLVLFHMEQGGLVPPEVVRALARGSRKSEVSEALRRWQPEPLTVEQLGEQFCGLVRYFATLGFFASGAPCVVSGRLLDRGREDPFQGARVALPCPVSGENAGRTYTRASEPEEPFFRTALNLAKDHDLFTACFTRNLDGMRKAKLVQQLPAFRRLEEQNLVPPMQRLVERVQRTLETRGRSGYEKFAGRLATGGPRQHQPQHQHQHQPQQQHQLQHKHQPYRQRPLSASSVTAARASSSPVGGPPRPLREISRPRRPVLVVPRSCSSGSGHVRQLLPPIPARRQAKSAEKPPAPKSDGGGDGGVKNKAETGKGKRRRQRSSKAASRPKGEAPPPRSKSEAAKTAKATGGSEEVTAKENEGLGEAVVKAEKATKSELLLKQPEPESEREQAETTKPASTTAPPDAALKATTEATLKSKSSSWAEAAITGGGKAKSTSADLDERPRRPLAANNRTQPPQPQVSQSVPPQRVMTYAGAVSSGKK